MYIYKGWSRSNGATKQCLVLHDLCNDNFLQKNAVYADKPRTVEQLKLKIIDACSQFTAPLCRKVCYSVDKRLGKCIELE